MTLGNNKISVLSQLKDIFINLASVDINYQSVELLEVDVLKTSTTLEIDNPLVGLEGTIFDAITVIDGSYNSPKVKWEGLTRTFHDVDQTVTYVYKQVEELKSL